MKKTLKQSLLNKAIDRCTDVLGSSRATDRQKTIALKLLNKCYERSGVPIHLNSFGEIGLLKGAKHGR